MPITTVNDIACIRGSLKSVLKDAYGCNVEVARIIADIDSKTGKNGDALTVTQWNREDLKGELEKELFMCEYIEISPDDDFSTLMKEQIDNETSFGILFWKGIADGNGQHATRLERVVSEHSLRLLDTTVDGGKIFHRTLQYLREKSSRGFTFLKMVKRTT